MSQLGGTVLEALGSLVSAAGNKLKTGASGVIEGTKSLVGYGQTQSPQPVDPNAPAPNGQQGGRRRNRRKNKKQATKKAGRRSRSRSRR